MVYPETKYAIQTNNITHRQQSFLLIMLMYILAGVIPKCAQNTLKSSWLIRIHCRFANTRFYSQNKQKIQGFQIVFYKIINCSFQILLYLYITLGSLYEIKIITFHIHTRSCFRIIVSLCHFAWTKVSLNIKANSMKLFSRF